MKLERLLAITMLLINRKRITAAELADYFEVSVRTIHRDINAINQAGIPIVAYQGVNGGFGIMDNYKIDRQVLSADDINSMIIALKGAATSLDDQKFVSTIAKLKILAPEPEVKSLKPDQLILDFSPWGGNRIQQAKIDLIKKAISDEILIDFKYTNYQGEIGTRLVEPMALILKGFTWYFLGFCRSKEDYRLFRLSRIRDLKTLTEKFKRREKDLSNLPWERQWKPERSVKLILRFTSKLRAITQDYFDAENVREEADGYLVVETELPDEEWSYNYILNYGEGVEVLEPQYIREIIREKARRIAELYR